MVNCVNLYYFAYEKGGLIRRAAAQTYITELKRKAARTTATQTGRALSVKAVELMKPQIRVVMDAAEKSGAWSLEQIRAHATDFVGSYLKVNRIGAAKQIEALSADFFVAIKSLGTDMERLAAQAIAEELAVAADAVKAGARLWGVPCLRVDNGSDHFLTPPTRVRRELQVGPRAARE